VNNATSALPGMPPVQFVAVFQLVGDPLVPPTHVLFAALAAEGIATIAARIVTNVSTEYAFFMHSTFKEVKRKCAIWQSKVQYRACVRYVNNKPPKSEMFFLSIKLRELSRVFTEKSFKNGNLYMSVAVGFWREAE
jgi:hypothetical protein